MLRPDARVSHDFAVENRTQEDWVLEKVTQSCSCSVATASSSTIKAGGTERFTFAYHAPAAFADERRFVTLDFRGKAKHRVDLIVTAFVRPLMVLRPGSLNFGNLPVGGVAYRSLEVDNFGPTNWASPGAASLPSGVSVARAAKVERPRKGFAPRETWAVDLRVDCAALSPGAFRNRVEFRADGDAKADLPVEFVVGIPVVARPSLLMLGQVERSRPVEATTTLKFFGGKAPCSPERVDVSCSALRLVSKRMTAIGGDSWKLVVTVEPGDDSAEYPSGKIIIAFPDGDPADVVIPISAHVRPRS